MMMIETGVAGGRTDDITSAIQPAELPHVNAVPVNNL
jgi:hypothetical protein